VPLGRGEDEKAGRILQTAYRCLNGLHHRLNRSYRDEREYGKEYEWYLREPDKGTWAEEWREVWGDSSVSKVKDAGGEFSNPFYVLDIVTPLQRKLRIGAIHGDLHPGNIVLNGEHPHIIDFGWAKDDAHIAKDFVLMECNLRFHMLRPSLNQDEIYKFCDWVGWYDAIPTGLRSYTKRRAELIQALRDIASKTIRHDAEEVNWDWEYIVPLFLVAFGMLRFTPHLGNQQAAIRFILALASHVERIVENRTIESPSTS
jgi:hypothetical protein